MKMTKENQQPLIEEINKELKRISDYLIDNQVETPVEIEKIFQDNFEDLLA